jgi:hypothetical protein
MPDGLYFWIHLPFDKTHPQSPLDWIFFLLDAAVWVFTALRLWKAFKEKNAVLFLLPGLMLLNLLALVFSGQTHADTINARRYFYPSGVCFSLMTGLLFSTLGENRTKWIKNLAPALALLFLGGVGFHFYQLLSAPDEMREFRWLIGELDKNHINRALADWPNDIILDGLTTQRIITAELYPHFIPEYASVVSQADTIAFIQMGAEPLEPKITYQGRIFRKSGGGANDGFFFWAPYQAGTPP